MWASEEFYNFQSTKLPPYTGGSYEQEAEWVEAINCISAAKNTAESDHQAEESVRMKEEQSRRKQSSGSSIKKPYSKRPRRRR